MPMWSQAIGTGNFHVFFLGFKFDSEYIVYILCGIAFDFNYKWGTIFDTHCNSVSVLGM